MKKEIWKEYSKNILQYNLKGEFIKSFGGNREIMRELGIDQSSISKACKGKLKTSGGFIWKYGDLQ